MESYALALSPSTPFINNHHKPPPLRNPRFFTPSLHYYSSHRNSLSLCSTSSFNNRTALSLLFSNRKLNEFIPAAASVPESSADEASKGKDLGRILQLGGMFGLWYLLNIYYNIFNKQVTLLSLSRNIYISPWAEVDSVCPTTAYF